VGHLTTKTLERIRIRDRRVVLQEKLLLDLDERIRDVKVGPDNRIYVLTDHQDARLLRLQPGNVPADQQDRVARKLAQAVDLEGNVPLPNIEPGDPVIGKQAFLEHCSACHRVGRVVQGGGIGPDLGGVFGRKIGTLPGFRYSAALADSPQVWNARTLNLFMANPQIYLPGTTMTTAPISDPDMRRHIVGFLQLNSLP
jgi:cytochrome c